MKQISNYITEKLIIKKDALNDTFDNDTEYADLQLPSGLLWARLNFGAKRSGNPETWLGEYYAFGELKPNKSYTYDYYKHYDKSNKSMKYGKHGLQQLDKKDDVIYVSSSDDSFIPSKEDLHELIESTTCEKVTNYHGIKGLDGYVLISKYNEEELFFPYSGFISNGKPFLQNHAIIGCSTPSKFTNLFTNALNINTKLNVNVTSVEQRNGLQLRAVKKK